jgi:hypothetical protein
MLLLRYVVSIDHGDAFVGVVGQYNSHERSTELVFRLMSVV